MEINVTPAHERARVDLGTEIGTVRVEDDYENEETRIIVGDECVYSDIWNLRGDKS